MPPQIGSSWVLTKLPIFELSWDWVSHKLSIHDTSLKKCVISNYEYYKVGLRCHINNSTEKWFYKISDWGWLGVVKMEVSSDRWFYPDKWNIHIITKKCWWKLVGMTIKYDSRFKSQLILRPSEVLRCLIYTDLPRNPAWNHALDKFLNDLENDVGNFVLMI